LEVTLSIVGFMWTNHNAAFAVTIPDVTTSGILLPCCKNTFPHITLWHLPSISAAASNNLPLLVAQDDAESINFEVPKQVQGVIRLWD
jgi:hypothetical protein